jgi:hypothetical protein
MALSQAGFIALKEIKYGRTAVRPYEIKQIFFFNTSLRKFLLCHFNQAILIV